MIIGGTMQVVVNLETLLTEGLIKQQPIECDIVLGWRDHNRTNPIKGEGSLRIRVNGCLRIENGGGQPAFQVEVEIGDDKGWSRASNGKYTVYFNQAGQSLPNRKLPFLE